MASRLRTALVLSSISVFLIFFLHYGLWEPGRRLFPALLQLSQFVFALFFLLHYFPISWKADRTAVRVLRFGLLLLALGLLILLVLEWWEGPPRNVQLVSESNFLAMLLGFVVISDRLVQITHWNLHPALVFVLSFLALIFLGTLLLLLPRATHHGISIVDALFTATSAVCVTGLIVLDTGKDFTAFGQTVILLLIQLGGLGILTFTNLFALFFTGRQSFKARLMLHEFINADNLSKTFNILVKIVLFTLVVEAIGVGLIYLLAPVSPELGNRLFFSLFHAISAFCNAGFSTLSGSLYEPVVRYHYGLQLVVAALFIVGGLGYGVVINYYAYLKSRLLKWLDRMSVRKIRYSPPKRIISINTVIVVNTTLFLIVAAWGLYFAFEYDHSLREYPFWGKVAASFFGAVTPRTAGFNSVDLSELAVPTILIYLLLMWIGASPGSTGGGIKTTTFALASMSIVHQMFGRPKLTFRWKEVPLQAINRTAAVISLSLMAVGLSAFLILIFDPQLDPLQVAFESFSAYGTVGLSLGITAELSAPSKLVLVATMFLGRVGFLTLLSGIARQLAGEHLSNYQYPAEPIFIN
ncbi:MAG: hypothetical protein KDC32_02075 [Saprospiraceae bacterium]|nr:hypothetical protein [Saprospiraceae bacterium]MCB0679739.1 hypothetical protein [Saprospiraceae bacterium]